MPTKILLTALLLVCELGFSQNKILVDKGNYQDSLHCQAIAQKSADRISRYQLTQVDSISRILADWDLACAGAEPIQRLKILLEIKNKSLRDTLYKQYIQEFITKYKYRKIIAEDPQYNQIFELNKDYLDYVPLRSRYDSITKQLATELRPLQKHGTSEYLFCLLFSNDFSEFDREIRLSSYDENFIRKNLYIPTNTSWGPNPNFIVVSGLWIPVGKMAKHFSTSPEFGLILGLPIQNNFNAELGAIVRPLVNDINFDLNIDDSVNSVDGVVCLTFGAWLTKEFKISDNLYFDALAGIGMGRIDTDLKKPKKEEDDDDTYYGVATYDVSAGIRMRWKFPSGISLGTNLNYHYAPYKPGDLLKSNLGSQYFSFTMLFRY